MSDLSSDPVPSEVNPNPDPKLDSNQLAKLAEELANRTFNHIKVLRAYNLTMAQFEQYIAPNPFFKQAYDAAVIEWNAATSTAKRIKVRSAAALEQSLPALHSRMVDTRETLPAAVETAKLFAKLAGVGEEKQSQAVGERFTISINIGTKKIEQEVQPTIDVTPQKVLEKPID